MRNVGSSFKKWQGVLVAAVCVSAIVSNLGCKKLLAKRDAGAGASSSGGTAQDDADEQLSEKLDEYIKCLNTLSSSIHQSRHRYLTYIPRTGPTGREAYADLYKLPYDAPETISAAA